MMLVLDVSGSMDARDLRPTRLGAARQAAKKLVDGLPNGARPAGAAADQRPGRASARSRRLALGRREQHGSTTGRGGHSRAAGRVTVNTIGVGQCGVQTALNRRTSVGLDETALKSIADVTNGQYFYAADAGQLEQVYAHLGSQIQWVTEQTEVTALASGRGAARLTIAGVLGLGWFGRLPCSLTARQVSAAQPLPPKVSALAMSAAAHDVPPGTGRPLRSLASDTKSSMA